MYEAADDKQESVAAGAKKLTPKRIKSRLERTEANEDQKYSRKKRNKMAHALLVQMASGQIKNPQAAAQAYIAALDTTEAEESAAAEE